MFFKSFVFLGVVLALAAFILSVVGYRPEKKLTGEDLQNAEELLRSVLSTLADRDLPDYKVSKIIWATAGERVGGDLYNNYEADLIDGKNVLKKCFVEIEIPLWSLYEEEVTFKCKGPGNAPATQHQHQHQHPHQNHSHHQHPHQNHHQAQNHHHHQQPIPNEH